MVVMVSIDAFGGCDPGYGYGCGYTCIDAFNDTRRMVVIVMKVSIIVLRDRW